MALALIAVQQPVPEFYKDEGGKVRLQCMSSFFHSSTGCRNGCEFPLPSLLKPPLAFRRTVEPGGHCHTFPQYSQPTPTHPARTAPIRPVARRVCRATACHSRWRCTIRRRTCRTGYVAKPRCTLHKIAGAGAREWGDMGAGRRRCVAGMESLACAPCVCVLATGEARAGPT